MSHNNVQLFFNQKNLNLVLACCHVTCTQLNRSIFVQLVSYKVNEIFNTVYGHLCVKNKMCLAFPHIVGQKIPIVHLNFACTKNLIKELVFEQSSVQETKLRKIEFGKMLVGLHQSSYWSDPYRNGETLPKVRPINRSIKT